MTGRILLLNFLTLKGHVTKSLISDFFFRITKFADVRLQQHTDYVSTAHAPGTIYPPTGVEWNGMWDQVHRPTCPLFSVS